jgi:putative acetyltransferase
LDLEQHYQEPFAQVQCTLAYIFHVSSPGKNSIFNTNMSAPLIRDIQPSDNPLLANLIRDVLIEFEVPKEGSTYADKVLDTLYEHYSQPRAAFYVVELDGEIVGCGGVIQLDNYKGNICELQKMYFTKAARGKGIGSKILTLCLEKAKKLGFDQVYLETRSNMKVAQDLYLKYGFYHLDKPIGDTGHYVCPVWMLKDL